MEERSVEIRQGIAEALDCGASLLVRRVARSASLTPRMVLRTLDEEGPTRLTELASATGVSQPAMTQLVGRMEREGCVVRLIDPDDARATLVDLTDAGRELRGELLESVHERLAELLDTLSPDEEATLGLAMCVALPLIERMTHHATENPKSHPAPVALTAGPA